MGLKLGTLICVKSAQKQNSPHTDCFLTVNQHSDVSHVTYCVPWVMCDTSHVMMMSCDVSLRQMMCHCDVMMPEINGTFTTPLSCFSANFQAQIQILFAPHEIPLKTVQGSHTNSHWTKMGATCIF